MPGGEQPKKKNLGLLIGVGVAAIILIAGLAFGGIMLFGGEKFEQGGCVKQEGSEAVAVSCDDKDAKYKITKQVKKSSECKDQTMPVVKLEDEGIVYCLEAADKKK